MSQRLYFGCYAPDDNVKSCPQKRICKKEGCGGDHPAGLHGSFKLKSKDPSKLEPERSDVKSNSTLETKIMDMQI